MARCPAHGDRTPSLSIRAGDGDRALVYCHAGCGQARVVAALRSLGIWGGISDGIDHRPRASLCEKERAQKNLTARIRAASRIWRSSQSLLGSPAEIYLRSRGLRTVGKHDALRFHPRLRHPSGGYWPALIGIVLRGHDSKPLGIHRTFLTKDGSGKAPVQPQKMMLGPCRGGAVHLARAGEIIMVGEGVETCLSAMQATGLSGMGRFVDVRASRSQPTQGNLRRVIVLADGDRARQGDCRPGRCHQDGSGKGGPCVSPDRPRVAISTISCSDAVPHHWLLRHERNMRMQPSQGSFGTLMSRPVTRVLARIRESRGYSLKTAIPIARSLRYGISSLKNVSSMIAAFPCALHSTKCRLEASRRR